MDSTRAAQSHFGGRVAHGSLLISIALGLGSMDVPQPASVALVGTSWRFLNPVKPGMTVHAVWRLSRKRDVTNPQWGLAVWQVELDDQNQERVMEGEVTLLVGRRNVAAAAAPRSRRRRRGKAAAPPLAATAEANLPEPAADTPSPASRRRRPSKPPATAEPSVAGPATESAPEPVSALEAAAPSTSSRRRRRRRGGGGGGGGGASAGNGSGTGAAPAAESAPAAVHEPAPAAEPARSQWAAPEPAKPAKPADGNPVSRVFGRLRRPRPAAPAPEGTRSPSE